MEQKCLKTEDGGKGSIAMILNRSIINKILGNHVNPNNYSAYPRRIWCGEQGPTNLVLLSSSERTKKGTIFYT